MACLAGVLVALIWAYRPAMSPALLFDDYAHLPPLYETLTPPNLKALWEAVWSNNSGPTHRPVAMLSFALQVAIFHAGVEALKWTNLAIHALVGLLLFLLGRRLLDALGAPRAGMGAATAALLWLLHPFNLTSVAYVIQRMNSLSALFVVAALWLYVRARTQGQGALNRSLPGILALWLAGILSKENAVLLPVYAGVLELTVLWRACPPTGWITRIPGRVLAGILVLAGLLVVGWATDHYAPGFAGRPFSLEERVLTETRVLAWYLGQILLPRIGEMGLYHDDFGPSTGWLSPATTLAAAVFLAMLLGTALWQRRRWPLYSLGVLWFLGGHLLESTVLPLELVFEHRNYLPMFGPLLFVAAAPLAWLGRRSHRGLTAAYAAIAVLAAGTLAWQTHVRAQRWAEDPSDRIAYLESRTGSLRAGLMLAETHSDAAANLEDEADKQAHLQAAETAYQTTAQRFGDRPEILVGWILLREYHGTGDAAPLLDRLEQVLPTATVSAATINGIHALTLCAISKRCPKVTERLPVLIQKAMLNPGFDRNRLLRDRAEYEFHVQNDPQRALVLLEEAVRLAPRSLPTWLRLATYRAIAGDQPGALDALDHVAALDRLGTTIHTRELLRLAILSRQLERRYGKHQPRKP